jgi:hypothetical protein
MARPNCGMIVFDFGEGVNWRLGGGASKAFFIPNIASIFKRHG